MATTSSTAASSGCSEMVRLFECVICHENLKDAHICPTCSKAFCRKCIDGWLHESPTCPCCKQPLTEATLVKARTFDEAQDVVNRMRVDQAKEDRNRCGLHRKEMSLFCLECEACICPGCLFTETHVEHKDRTVLIEQAFVEYDQKIKDVLQKIKAQKTNISCTMEKVGDNRKLLTVKHDEQKNEMQRLRTLKRTNAVLFDRANALSRGVRDASSLTAILGIMKSSEEWNYKWGMGVEPISVLLTKDVEKPEGVKINFQFERFAETLKASKVYESDSKSMLGFTWRLKAELKNDNECTFSLRMEEGIPGDYMVQEDFFDKKQQFELHKDVEIFSVPLSTAVAAGTDSYTQVISIVLAENYAQKCTQMKNYIAQLEKKISDNDQFMQYLADHLEKHDSGSRKKQKI